MNRSRGRRTLVPVAAAGLIPALAAALQIGCASPAGLARLAAADLSQGSSQGQGGSSETSGATSQDSNESSRSSGDSSRSSGESMRSTGDSSKQGGSSDPNVSSKGSSNESSRNAGNASAVVAGSALLLSTLAGIGFAIYGTVRSARRSAQEQAKTAHLYLRANELQLRQDLAFGAGPTIDDLACAAQVRVEHKRDFALLLQRHRAELLALAASDELTEERALAFLARIGELLAEHPTLKLDRQAWLALHAGADEAG